MLTLEEKLKKIAESSQISPTPKLSLKDKLKKIMELEKTGKLQIEGELLYPLPPSPATPEEEPTVSIPPVPPETQQALEKLASGELPMQKIGELETAIPYAPPWKKQAPIPSEKELVQRQVMETLVEKSRGPFTISAENAVNSLVQEITNIPQPVKSVGSFLGYSLKSGINQANANIVWLANQVASGTLSLGENIGELFGKPENWLEPTKLKTIQALTNVMNMYQQQAAVDIEKALSGVPMEQLSPAGQEVVAVLAESIGATVPVLISLFAGMGMPQITGIAAQISTWAPTINQFLRMTPFMVFGGTSHARDVENQLQQAGLPPDKAKTWGAFIVGGLFEGVTESPVFEQLAKTMGVQGTKKLFSQLFTDIVVNAEQEAIMVPITKSYQQLLGLPQDWDAKNLITEMGRDGLAGAFMGLMLGVNVKGAKTSQQKLADILNKYNDGKIDVVQMVNEVDKVITQDKQLQKTLQKTYKESVAEEKVIPEIKSEEAAETVTPEAKEPWQMTKEEFSRFDIEIPAGGTSKSPSQIWQWRAMEASGEKVGETLADLVQYSDTSRIKEILGPQYSSLISKIQQGKEITVWRAQPKDQPPGIIPGSYVSESKTYAKQHGENVLGGDYILTSEKVYPDELFVYGDPHEFIYYPRDVETAHKRIIQKAIEENKPVPIEVLREYPELQKTVPITEKVAQPLVGEKVVEAPIAPGTGEWKTRGLAEHVQRNIIAKDIEMIFEDLPQYQAVSSKQATDQIMQLIKQDYPRAVKMALGEEPVPQGILPGWIWTAVQNEATLRKDYETLNKLTSENAMMQFATILGQNVQAFADKNPVSVVAITHEISKAAEKRLEEKYPGKKIKDIKQRQEKKLKESIKEYAPK
ncbi:MAG: hypothetical protein WBI47_11065, partial [Atribacterales bacterium]